MKRLRMPSARIVLAACLLPLAAHAYVDVELNNGRHVLGESYSEQNGKLVVHRPIGGVELDRASVRGIRELEGSMPSDAQKTVEAAPPPSTAGDGSSAPVETHAASSGTPKERSQEITAKLFEVYRFRLAAKNRGDDEAFKKYDKEAKELVDERLELLEKRKSDKPGEKAD